MIYKSWYSEVGSHLNGSFLMLGWTCWENKKKLHFQNWWWFWYHQVERLQGSCLAYSWGLFDKWLGMNISLLAKKWVQLPHENPRSNTISRGWYWWGKLPASSSIRFDQPVGMNGWVLSKDHKLSCSAMWYDHPVKKSIPAIRNHQGYIFSRAVTKTTASLGGLPPTSKFLSPQEAYSRLTRGVEWEAGRKVSSIFAQATPLRRDFEREVPCKFEPFRWAIFDEKSSISENFH
jgi:hypothetical protein